MRTSLQQPPSRSACRVQQRAARSTPSGPLHGVRLAAEALGRKPSSEMPPRSSSSGVVAARATSSSSSPPSEQQQQARVLMVCLGNICRSPAAEAVLVHLVKQRKLGGSVFVDSCGTGGGSGDWYKEGGFSYHEGDAADSRMRSAASKRGIAVTSRSRPLTPRDFEEFDVIVAMDAANKAAIARAKEHWISKGKLKVETSSEQGKGSEEEEEEELRAKVVMMTDFLRNEKLVKLADGAVPDPYYGGDKGFETVLDLLEDACEGLLEELLA